MKRRELCITLLLTIINFPIHIMRKEYFITINNKQSTFIWMSKMYTKTGRIGSDVSGFGPIGSDYNHQTHIKVLLI